MIAFGPIPSRRLGLSLGINNIVSRKVCSYSCVYCQIGTSEYEGRMHTETMLVENYNDRHEQIKQTAFFIAEVNPETAYLAIPTRPPAFKEVKPVTEENLAMAWQTFRNAGINTELLTGFEGTDTGFTGNAFEDILNITAVHPLREDTMSKLLKKENTDMSVVDSLVEAGTNQKNFREP